MKDIIKKLNDENIGKVTENEPLAKHTTMKIGGPADLLIEPNTIQDLEKAIRIIKENHLQWTAIGRGSNLLVSDGGIEGVVIKLGKGLDHLEENGEEITVGGGYSLVKLSTIMSRKGLSGLEFASGIPGSLGGAVFMNAGAHGSDMSEILVKAHILFEDGTMEWLSNEEMEFSYRTSILQRKPGICLEAVLSLKEGNREQITAIMQKNKDYRKETQPWNYPCCGSVFRNPLPEHAGHLIESSGLKGHSIGGAQISDLHANFIVNTGDATAKDVLDLIDLVKNTIKDKYDIHMETEVEMIGREKE
ncbi:UDP-N-acetylmuramate dehydrogenase [Pseudalkalibacillus berkeleyi]|uniref:UDP-N-acetylenolpyruvoylglucosamine reductase n=1 Tax=Pseudalkalibacillus berkeleyi TaxID=1069813 RepID=A0ABS9GW41_9BACL|nr:UDP-N-acetylmuramate dehydrogenase [Pseudalkalibacillus berkeleyi]MCF6137014.1 UDP-N-acetylmuramate dehydrogenase [Pseudalkalibacillus berkeleyi]